MGNQWRDEENEALEVFYARNASEPNVLKMARDAVEKKVVDRPQGSIYLKLLDIKSRRNAQGDPPKRPLLDREYSHAIHPGVFMRRFMVENWVSVNSVARKIGESPSRLTLMIDGFTEFPVGTYIETCNAMGVDASVFFREQDEYIESVRLVERLGDEISSQIDSGRIREDEVVWALERLNTGGKSIHQYYERLCSCLSVDPDEFLRAK